MQVTPTALNRGFARSQLSRFRVWGSSLAWILAAFAALGAASLVFRSATFPRKVAAQPIRADAQVVAVYINGLGGDPGVDYRYRVGDREYLGSGDGALGQEDLLSLRPGDKVAIEYSGIKPSESCTCNARRHEPPPLPVAIMFALTLVAPLAFLSLRSATRRRRRTMVDATTQAV